MKTILSSDETIKRQAPANLQRGWESVGGHLYLTNERLVFESHAFNVQSGTTTLDLVGIKDVTKCWTRFLNLFPIAPNSIKVETKDGFNLKFVVYNRDKWISEIRDSLVV